MRHLPSVFTIMKRVLSILVLVLFSVSTVSAASFKPGVRIKKEKFSEMRDVPMYNYYQRGRQIDALDLMKELEKYKVSHKNAKLAHEYRSRMYRWCPLMILFPLGTLYVVLGPHQELKAKFWKYLDRAVNQYNRNPRSRKIKK
jgi:hypothetical protein